MLASLASRVVALLSLQSGATAEDESVLTAAVSESERLSMAAVRAVISSMVGIIWNNLEDELRCVWEVC